MLLEIKENIKMAEKSKSNLNVILGALEENRKFLNLVTKRPIRFKNKNINLDDVLKTIEENRKFLKSVQ